MASLRVRELAEPRGFNITTLSRKSELAYTTVYTLWHDSAKVWNRRSLDALARALGVRVVDLIKEEPAAG